MTDLQTIERIYRAQHNKKAVDRVCKGFAIVLVGGFWVLIVSLVILEMGR